MAPMINNIIIHKFQNHKIVGLFTFSIIYSIISNLIGFFVPIKYMDDYLIQLPMIIGILLAGILASLAIIFSLVTSKEIQVFNQLSELKGRDNYRAYLSNIEKDVKIIFIGFIFSLLLPLLFSLNIFNCNFLAKKVIFAFAIYILILTIDSIYDTLSSMFTLNNLKYQLSKK